MSDTTDAQDKRKGCILFVDDEKSILSSLKRLFRTTGHIIHTAESGAAGLEILKAHKVDLVVSDMRMPEMDGAAFLQQVAQRWPETVRILLTGYSEMNSTVEAINKGHIFKYINKPWDDCELKLAVDQALDHKFLQEERDALLVLTNKQNVELTKLNNNLEDIVRERTQELQETMGLLRTTNENLKKSYTSAIKIFANLIEMREGSIAGHSRKVADKARALALKLGMSDKEAQDVLFAALLHDMGKIGLSDEIIKKPYDDLNTAEKVEVHKHPVIAQAVLMAQESLHAAGALILSHHEAYDGTGFPSGLKGNVIPLGSRIIAVIDTFDALQNGEIFAKKYSKQEAQAYLVQHKGTLFDPKVVDTFFDLDKQCEKETQRIKTTIYGSEQLNEGMILADDVVTGTGVFILAKDQTLDSKMILTIKNFEKAIGEQFDIKVQLQ